MPVEGLPTFRIPGNIKQGYLPFVIDPENKINTIGEDSSATKGASPQFFSYREKTDKLKTGAKLGVYPSSKLDSKLNKDISLKLLYKELIPSNESLEIDDIMSSIPALSIREFLPDTRLDQCLNFFKDMFEAAQDVMASTKTKQKDGQTNFQELANDIWACAQYTMLYLLGISWKTSKGETYNKDQKGFFKDFCENAGKIDKNFHVKYKDDNNTQKIVDFPFMFYYRLQSCVTTNIYEIPAVTDGKIINQSDGKAGWGSGSGLLESGGLRASGFLNKIPMIGELANSLLGNIGINYMPWWNPEEGAKTAAPEINVKFDLFNDTIEKAVANFIFVNTIIPGNRWIQYGMFQHSSNLYDVKIEGLNRLFVCAASFNVTYDGVLRNPPKNFFGPAIDPINGNKYASLDAHVSKTVGNKENFLKTLYDNNLVKIPDVYHVEMSFKSLLPANFNNFIFAFSKNVNHMTQYKDDAYQPGIGGALSKTIGDFSKKVAKVFSTGNINDGFK